MNTVVSRSGSLQFPTMLANGWLQRWDIRELVPNEKLHPIIMREVLKLYATDPYFHDVRDGSIDFLVFEQLLPIISELPDTDTPVVRADWFVVKALTSIEGGRYLELRGLIDSEEASLARVGAFEAQAIAVDGDRRVGMFQSKVTGKARSVLALNTFVGRAWITEDIFDEDVDESRHPIYNLIDNNYRGREIIAEMANGLHLFLITDDKGTILREAPPQLVTDHRVPSPNTDRLQAGAISCIRCHAEESGLRSCDNDVAKLLAGPLVLNGERQFVDDVTTRYSGRDFDRHLLLGREDYEATIDRLTQGEMDVVKLSQLLSDIYSQYRYELVTPEKALREAGVDMEGVDPFVEPVLIFREFLAIDSSSNGLLSLEDPSIAALSSNIPIRRSDFERIHPRLAYRIALIRSRLAQTYRSVE